jgi:hypothetical protein
MFHFIKGIAAPSPAAAIGKAIAVTMLSAVAACGGGSDGTEASGTKISAVSNAVLGAKGKPDLPDDAPNIARRVVPFDPVVNSVNPATQKLARIQCLRADSELLDGVTFRT